MGKAEEIHELIYTNLCLLRARGHHINFEQDMFKEHNLPGFEAVGFALLMIIDPVECKNKIPWPLINDKVQTREFRTNFTKFIKMINSKYPDALIPEITASSLQFPGGMNFLNFMYKLSTFALELELRNILSSEERENFLPKPLMSEQAKDLKVKVMAIRGALHREKEALLRFRKYEEDGSLVLRKVNDCLNNVTTKCNSVSELLKLEVASLEFDEKTKKSLNDINDSAAITDYNEKIEKKWKEIESNSHKLSQLHDLAVQCCQQKKTSLETQCLDGHKLGFNRFLNQLVGGSIVNADGDVKLSEVLKASYVAATRLTRTSGSDPLLLPVQNLQTQCNSSAIRAHKVESTLQRLCDVNSQAVLALRPVVYPTLTKKRIPDAFKLLKERPPLNFVLSQSAVKKNRAVKQGRRRKSFGSIIHRKSKVICSFKTKREPKKHVSSTPFFKTPACRKSLYNTLPSGTRHKRIEEDTPLEVTPDNPMPLTPLLSSQPNQESVVSGSSTFNSLSTETSSPQPTPVLRCGRKSLNDIVDRFLKLKKSMNMSTNSKNELDMCNESEHEAHIHKHY